MRAKAEIEENKKGTFIVVTELPYQATPNAILSASPSWSTAASSTASPTSTTSRPATTPSSSSKLKRDANANVVLNNLFKHTPLQTSFGVNMVALVDGVPRTLNLVQALQAYVDHQVDVITRRSEFRLGKAESGPTSSRACSRRST